MSEFGWWIVRNIVLPYLAKVFRLLMIIKDVRESIPEVGSSSIMTCGFVSNSSAIEVLFFYPPDTPLIIGPPTTTSRHLSSFIL